MAKDFFGSLSDTFAKTAKDLTGRVESIYETQKLKNKISGEERELEKTFADLGRIIYRRYKEGIPVDEAEDTLCQQIDDRYQQIEQYKKEAREAKEQRFCPNCGSIVGKNDAFCSKCGASCPVPEPKDDDGSADVEESSEEVTEETAEETCDSTEEAVQEEVIPEWKPEEHTGNTVSLEKKQEDTETVIPEEEEHTEEATEETVKPEDTEPVE